ncbi:MAG: hypothetical protein M3Q49_04355 [Actinomycetota bacterium]|nr:hypothetical protein [Actinomycetota bacterium]
MQQSTSANIEQRFGHAVEEVQNILAEHEKTCAERVQAAEGKGQGDRARFAEVCEELARGRRELTALVEERERLPFEAFRANMDGDVELEAQLRKRHQEINPEHLEALRCSCGELEAEKNALGGTSRGAERRASGNALEAYASVLADLERFEDRIAALREPVAEVRGKLGNGQRRVEEHLQLLRQLERDERREERAEAARRSEGAVTGTRGRVIG